MSAMARPLRVGGVPEHFNVPLLLAGEHELYREHGLEAGVQFTAVPAGSAPLLEGVANGTFDAVVALTEAVVASSIKRPSQDLCVLGLHVLSPLRWGVFTGAHNERVRSPADLDGLPLGISRLGSGSHIMAYLLARQHQWARPPGFKECHTITGLRAAAVDGSCGAFMWEIFMTRPHVLSGELREVGFVDTPWPSFVWVARRDFAQAHAAALGSLMRAVSHAAERFKANAADASVQRISRTFGLRAEHAREWLEAVQYARHHGAARAEQPVEQRLEQVLARTRDVLVAAGAVPAAAAAATAPEQWLFPWPAPAAAGAASSRL